MKASDPITSPPLTRGSLLRVLGVGFGLAVTIGNTIGAGILRTPGEVAAQLPNPWLFFGVWVAGGLYVLLGALSMAELATMIPQSGGQYVYARRALGDYAGFIVGWSDWISTCGTTAAVSIVIGEYTCVLFPSLGNQTVTIAIVVTVLFAVLQWRGIQWGSSIQNLTALLKTLAFVALIAACFLFAGRNTTPVATSVITGNASLLAAFIISLQAVIYTYDGWTGVIYFSEEVRNPARDIPRALFGGALAVIAIYLLVNAALLYVLPISQIAGSKLAAGTAAEALFGARGDTIIRALTIISMLSGINAYHLMATRVLFGLGRDGLFSNKVTSVNEGGTPTAALFLSTAVAVLFILSGTFDQVIAVLAFFFVANFTLSFLSVFVLRKTEPNLPRPFRTPGYPFTTVLSLLGSVAFLFGVVIGDKINGMISIFLLAVSWPIFLAMKRLMKPQN